MRSFAAICALQMAAMESEKSDCRTLRFASAAAANRRVAGVAAVARLVREAEGGSVRIVLPEGKLDARARADLARLAPDVELRVVGPEHMGGTAAPELDAWAILRATAKPGDGFVSRWLNRPVSQPISWLLLRIPGVRPLHATLGTALIALAMFAALLAGGEAGLIAGGLLFHAASVFDGVDGEIARATWRQSARGAVLDTAVDLATNLMFIAGLTLNLAERTGAQTMLVGGWALLLVVAGSVATILREARVGRAFDTGGVKRRYQSQQREGLAAMFMACAIAISSRDTFAFLFAVLILLGLALPALYVFAALATLWFLFVLASFLPAPPQNATERSA